MLSTETPNSPDQKKMLTPQEIADELKVSVDKATRLFIDEPDVVRIGHGPGRQRVDKATGAIKPVRQYFSIRVPKFVFDRVLKRLAVPGRSGGKAA